MGGPWGRVGGGGGGACGACVGAVGERWAYSGWRGGTCTRVGAGAPVPGGGGGGGGGRTRGTRRVSADLAAVGWPPAGPLAVTLWKLMAGTILQIADEIVLVLTCHDPPPPPPFLFHTILQCDRVSTEGGVKRVYVYIL